MTKTIHELIPDIYRVTTAKDASIDTDALSRAVAEQLKSHFGEKRKRPYLRISGLGDKCPCHLWHSIHKPEEAEKMPPWAEIKFSYGHILEATAIALAKAAGHEVTGEQDELELDGVVGHRDCVIDGCIVDVKSASSRSFEKFKTGRIAQDDPFGYLVQLDGYLGASVDDPLVRVKDRAYLLAIDKTLGHMCLYEHMYRPEFVRQRIKDYKAILARPEAPPCECKSIPDGQSGNMKLDMKASYNEFKYSCKPSLRTFLYSDGPRYLTKVVRLPNVTEVDRHGKVVYNGS